MRSGPRTGFLSTAPAVLAFGVAFGFVEAAVVVYLRAALEATQGAVAAHDQATTGTFEAVEVARELATLVMIASVGVLAGRRWLERLTWAAVVFGTWDAVYYLGLRIIIGWPPSVVTRDVLFLVPSPWVAPVWAPLAVSGALIAAGLVAARRLGGDGDVAVTMAAGATALAGGALVILSFLLDTELTDATAWRPWPVFWLGMGLAAVATLRTLTASPRRGGADGLAGVGGPPADTAEGGAEA